jgi:hypothetical protein
VFIKPPKKTKLRGLQSASELYRPSDRRLSAKLVPTFAGRGCLVVSTTDPPAVNSVFLTATATFSYNYPHEAEWTPFQTHSLANLVAPGIEPGTSESVAKNSDH